MEFTKKQKVILVLSICFTLIILIFTYISQIAYDLMIPRVYTITVIEVKGERYADVSYAGSCFVPEECIFTDEDGECYIYVMRSTINAFNKRKYRIEKSQLYRVEPHEEGIMTISSYDMAYFRGPVVYSSDKILRDGLDVNWGGEVDFQMELGEWWVV